MISAPANANSPRKPDETDLERGGTGPDTPSADPVTAPEDATVEDWVEAEASRPDLPDETADGLDDTDEEIRHQAEDLPLDTPGRLR